MGSQAQVQPAMHSCLYQGTVMHERTAPKKHRFVYRVFNLLLDLDELDRLDHSFKLLSVNRFNLFSFHEKDHGAGQGSLRQHIQHLLEQSGYGHASARIKLLCYPRILGYVFNPLSVYYCYDQDEQLQVIIYEVTNTFKERHSYLLAVGEDHKLVRHQCHKHMYVSPFTPMQSSYGFHIHPPADKVLVSIQQTEVNTAETQTAKPLLYAVTSGRKQSLSDRTLFRLFISHPLMTLKVISSIHWEALWLWLKGNKIYRHTPTHAYSLSWQDQTGASHYEVL